MKRLVSLLLFLACGAGIWAQSARVDASLNKTTVFKSDPVIYTIAVTAAYRARITEPSPPSVKGLRFSHLSTSSRSSITYQNLRAVSSYVTEFRYQYYPLSTGKFSFPAQNVVVDGNTYTAPAVSVEVKPDSKSPSGSIPQPSFNYGWDPFDQYDQSAPDRTPREQGKSFILALPQNQTVYRGQPALVSYYLYTNQDVRSYSNESTTDYDGYGKEIYESATQLQFERASYGGNTYRRSLLKTYAIYPQRTGDLRVPRISATVRWNYYSFFEQAVDSSPASVSVRDLPSGAPASFNGAVGRFAVSGALSRGNASVGNALTYTLRISGLGNYNQFSAPKFSSSMDLQISAPLSRDNLKGGCEGTRELVYTIIPRRAGTFPLPPLYFSWLDTASSTYQSFSSGPLSIKVARGGGTSSLSGDGGSSATAITHPMLDRDSYPHHRPLYARWWYWLLVLAIPASLLWSASVARKRKLLLQDPQARASREAAKELAKLRADCATLAQKGSLDFHATAEKGLLAYFTTLFLLPSHLSTSEVLEALAGQGFTADQLTALRGFLDICRQVRYTPASVDPESITRDHATLNRIFGLLDNRKASSSSPAPGGSK